MSLEKTRILILSDFYLPAYKSGALRTVANMVERMSDEFDFYILTGNCDSDGDSLRFADVQLDQWQTVGKAKVFYLSPENLNLKFIGKLIADTKPDAVYLNSFFSPLTIKFLSLRKLGKAKNIPVILAPEGEFAESAIKIKAKKKQLFLNVALPLGLYNNLIWKAVSKFEVEDIKRQIGKKGEILIAPNMPPSVILKEFKLDVKPKKKVGELHLIFLSRVSPVKNLKFALEILKNIKGEIHFDIYGSLEDENYWAECQEIIRELPENISINFLGAVSHDEVAETFSRYQFFLFPTTGENFGHVVIESLAGGTPVILSDQTPWQDLKKYHAGWVISLTEVSEWEKILQKCVDMNETDYLNVARKTRKYALDWLSAPEIENSNRRVLRAANRVKS